MEDITIPNVTPEKLQPFLRKADPAKLETLYRLGHHLIRGNVPEEKAVTAERLLKLMQEGTARQRLLIFQAAYHLIRRPKEN